MSCPIQTKGVGELGISGAGAAVVKRSENGRGLLSSFTRSDGTLAELLWRPGGGAKVPMDLAVLDEAQFIKNPEAKTTQACLQLRAQRRPAQPVAEQRVGLGCGRRLLRIRHVSWSSIQPRRSGAACEAQEGMGVRVAGRRGPARKSRTRATLMKYGGGS